MHEHTPALTAKAIFSAGAGMIAQAVETAHAFAADAVLSKGDAARLAVLVEELIANVCDHGGCESCDTVSLSLSANDRSIGIEMDDPGRAFDPTAAEMNGTVPERGGGAGIALVRAWASDFRYERRDGRNYTSVVISRDV
jgi:serine/threonine-protein kinase RsbW